MEITDILTITAIILGPVLAVQIEKILQRNRATREGKDSIFKILMATRGYVLSYEHVEALNRIDLEFSGNKKYSRVISSWKEYFDNLSQQVSADAVTHWSARNEELLSNLLFEMGNSLGYDFDKVLIKRNIYSPIAHDTIEREQQAVRRGVLAVLSGDKSIPFKLIQNQDNEVEVQQ